MIKTKSIYDASAEEDGLRVLVTRYWPRGVKKDRVHLWCKDLAPGPALIRAYKSEKLSWGEFRAAYLEDLGTSVKQQKTLLEAASIIREQAQALGHASTVTLLCTCRNSSLCHRSLLSGLLEGVF